MQFLFSIPVTMIRKLLTLAGLTVVTLMTPADSSAQLLDSNLPTPLRSAHAAKQDYVHDKPFQYSPCDPSERGKVFRLHTGHWGHFYNCDDEEAKRCSPYIYWKMNDKPTLPGHLGPLQAIRCEYAQVKQRILDGSCSECQKCGQVGCACCEDSVASACSTCNSAGCRGCGGNKTRARNVGGCADGNCGNCRECKLRGNVKRVSSTAPSTCATGDCGNCRQCTFDGRLRNAGASNQSRCGTGDCGKCSACTRLGRVKQVASNSSSPCGDCGQCAECVRRGRVKQAGSQASSACASGNCGQCRECKSHGIFDGLVRHKKCADGACAPEGFRGPGKACAREGNCGCVDTTFDAMAPAGLIYYVPVPGVAQSYVPSQDSEQPEAPAIEPLSALPAKVAPEGEKACGCAECRLANARQDLENWNAQQRDELRR